MKNIWNTLRLFLWLTFLLGIAYPLFITIIAQLTMRHKANGSFLKADGKIVGSSLIAQKFEKDIYFWPRPSANDYNPLASGGSNLGPTSALLKKAVDDRRENIITIYDVNDRATIPTELLYSSGSGLDPHISLKAAYFQLPRVLQARKWNEDEERKKVVNLIEQLTENRSFGFIGEPCVNVLKLNLALDQLNSSM